MEESKFAKYSKRGSNPQNLSGLNGTALPELPIRAFNSDPRRIRIFTKFLEEIYTSSYTIGPNKHIGAP